MQNRIKPFSLIFKSKYAQIFFCYGLGSCVFYFAIMLLHCRPIEADNYLVLNLVVPAILWFFVGLVINHWAQKGGTNVVAVSKILLAVVVLLFIHLVVLAIVINHIETVIPIAGNWLTFSVAPNAIFADGLLHFTFSSLPDLFMLPLVLLAGL